MATYQRECAQCGNDFTAGRRHARFCSSNCRNRNHRGKPPTAGVVVLSVVGARTTDEAAPADGAAEGKPVKGRTYDALEVQVRESLGAANALNTISGVAAIRIAQQIDKGGDAGSAVATLSKELSRLVGEAKVEAAPLNRDKADDIAALVNAKILKLIS